MVEVGRELEEDSLASLEERILRAVETVQTLREENGSLKRDLEDLRAEKEAANQELQEARAATARSMRELDDMKKELSARVRKMLGQLDLLSAS